MAFFAQSAGRDLTNQEDIRFNDFVALLRAF
jgi:hypothetical protein